MARCKFCGASDLVWKTIDGRWVLHTGSGERHACLSAHTFTGTPPGSGLPLTSSSISVPPVPTFTVGAGLDPDILVLIAYFGFCHIIGPVTTKAALSRELKRAFATIRGGSYDDQMAALLGEHGRASLFRAMLKLEDAGVVPKVRRTARKSFTETAKPEGDTTLGSPATEESKPPEDDDDFSPPTSM